MTGFKYSIRAVVDINPSLRDFAYGALRECGFSLRDLFVAGRFPPPVSTPRFHPVSIPVSTPSRAPRPTPKPASPLLVSIPFPWSSAELLKCVKCH